MWCKNKNGDLIRLWYTIFTYETLREIQLNKSWMIDVVITIVNRVILYKKEHTHRIDVTIQSR